MRRVVIVTGSRSATWDAYAHVRDALRALSPSEVWHGGAPGIDALAEHAARELGVPTRVWVADWATHGHAAGPWRNAAMVGAAPADAVLLAFPGGRGTADCVRRWGSRPLILAAGVGSDTSAKKIS